jgi:hypothetical protein
VESFICSLCFLLLHGTLLHVSTVLGERAFTIKSHASEFLDSFEVDLSAKLLPVGIVLVL